MSGFPICIRGKQISVREGRQAAADLDDFRLSVLGPEGLRWSGAADCNKAGGFAIQSWSDQLAAGCRSRYTEITKQWELLVFNPRQNGRNVMHYLGVVSTR